MPEARVGISGWRYPPWRGVFYPKGLRQADELTFAAERLTAIEINGSFYSLQRPTSWAAWRDGTPDDFVFAVKSPRYITHLLRLRNAEQAIANFLASGVLSLGPKLGPMLWQLPANLAYDEAAIELFLAALPRSTGAALELARGRDAERMSGKELLEIDADRPLHHAIEPRSATFDDPRFRAQLDRHGVTAVLGDSAGRWPVLDWAPATPTGADFAYARLHGDQELYVGGYDAPAIERWAAWTRAHLDAGRDVYVFFDNDTKVRAPVDAMSLIAALRS